MRQRAVYTRDVNTGVGFRRRWGFPGVTGSSTFSRVGRGGSATGNCFTGRVWVGGNLNGLHAHCTGSVGSHIDRVAGGQFVGVLNDGGVLAVGSIVLTGGYEGAERVGTPEALQRVRMEL
ncbi:MAG: hypothetical protein OSA95_13125, partial [Opitutales bacterium]|nr:hypothetical protein [Opitutales bacterium]